VALRLKIDFKLNPLIALRLLQSITRPCCRSVSETRGFGDFLAPLMGFLSPSTFQDWRIHSTGACLTPYVALSGFLTLSALCSPPIRPALFHAGDVHGVSPFRAFSSRGAVPPLGGLLALLMFTSRLPCHMPRSSVRGSGEPVVLSYTVNTTIARGPHVRTLPSGRSTWLRVRPLAEAIGRSETLVAARLARLLGPWAGRSLLPDEELRRLCHFASCSAPRA
jgi:hypothetical protein